MCLFHKYEITDVLFTKANWYKTFEGQKLANSDYIRETYYTEYTCSKCGKKKTDTHRKDMDRIQG